MDDLNSAHYSNEGQAKQAIDGLLGLAAELRGQYAYTVSKETSSELDIRDILLRRRIDLGLSQLDYAKALGYADRSAVSAFENGRRAWKFDTILRACNVLGLRIDIRDNT